jgi:hypothetical protein
MMDKIWKDFSIQHGERTINARYAKDGAFVEVQVFNGAQDRIRLNKKSAEVRARLCLERMATERKI